MMRFDGHRALVMGLGRHGGGVAAARYLAKQGAVVTVTDLAPAERLQPSLAALADLPGVRYRLGEHRREDFCRADLIVVNPAVRPNHVLLREASQRAARLTSEIELFLRACPAAVIGVTGSSGKSTTSSMLAAILEADGHTVWLGGNIGRSLLPELPRMRLGDWVVLELSSFQLHRLPDTLAMPSVAVVTNCTANHLDWHGDAAAYRTAKQRLLDGQTEDAVAVFAADEPSLAGWISRVRGTFVPPVDDGEIPRLRLVGRHDRRNAALALSAARAVGCHGKITERALANFRGLPHRLQHAGNAAGRRFLNDSKSTTPESLLAALDATAGRVWLIAGGVDKGFDLERLVRGIVSRAAGAAFIGKVGSKLYRLAASIAPDFPAHDAADLACAFDWCVEHAEAGNAVLLSPGFASLDQYEDYAARGHHFESLLAMLRGRDPSALPGAVRR